MLPLKRTQIAKEFGSCVNDYTFACMYNLGIGMRSNGMFRHVYLLSLPNTVSMLYGKMTKEDYLTWCEVGGYFRSVCCESTSVVGGQ